MPHHTHKCAAEAKQQKADEFFASVADDTYDAAISVLVLCTVPEPQRIVTELRRVLKPGGKVLLHLSFFFNY